jgi:hypothetical protein
LSPLSIAIFLAEANKGLEVAQQVTEREVTDYLAALASKGDSEDKHYVHTYCVQAANKFVDLSVRHQIEELELKQKDMVPSVLEKANKSADSWVSVVSNVDGVFRKSAFQKLCETSTSPIMIMPFQEVVGTGGVGY